VVVLSGAAKISRHCSAKILLLVLLRWETEVDADEPATRIRIGDAAVPVRRHCMGRRPQGIDRNTASPLAPMPQLLEAARGG
jgi:hypothetical protein